jgi:hypothetical protein
MQMHMTMTSCGAAVVDQDNEHSELLCLWRWQWRAHRVGDDAPSGDAGRGWGKWGIQGEWRLQGTPRTGEWRLCDLIHRRHCHLHWRRANKGVHLDDVVPTAEWRDPLPPRGSYRRRRRRTARDGRARPGSVGNGREKGAKEESWFQILET